MCDVFWHTWKHPMTMTMVSLSPNFTSIMRQFSICSTTANITRYPSSSHITCNEIYIGRIIITRLRDDYKIDFVELMNLKISNPNPFPPFFKVI